MPDDKHDSGLDLDGMETVPVEMPGWGIVLWVEMRNSRRQMHRLEGHLLEAFHVMQRGALERMFLVGCRVARDVVKLAESKLSPLAIVILCVGIALALSVGTTTTIRLWDWIEFLPQAVIAAEPAHLEP